MDNYYCLVRIQKNKSIVLFLFQDNIAYRHHIYPICFIAPSSYLMYLLLSKHVFFKKFSINHILYIGQEVYKAELSLTLSQAYVQD